MNNFYKVLLIINFLLGAYIITHPLGLKKSKDIQGQRQDHLAKVYIFVQVKGDLCLINT